MFTEKAAKIATAGSIATVGALAFFLLSIDGAGAQALHPAPASAQHPGCVAVGDPSVVAEGRPMLRLSDVVGCPGVRYDVSPNVFIGGEPAVRLAPSDRCGAATANSVLVNGVAAATSGAGPCVE